MIINTIKQAYSFSIAEIAYHYFITALKHNNKNIKS